MLFLTFMVANPKRILYTVANPVRGLNPSLAFDKFIIQPRVAQSALSDARGSLVEV